MRTTSLLACALLATIACTDSPTTPSGDPQPEPEMIGADVMLGDTVAGESIDAGGDIDRFTLHGSAGALVEILPRRTGGGSDTLTFAVGAVGVQWLLPTDTTFGSRGTVPVVIPDSGTISVIFGGLAPGTHGDVGGYEFIAFGIDSLPETHAANFALGDTITEEAIDPDGDIDRFTFTGVAGQFVTFEFRSILGTGADPLVFSLRAPDGSEVVGPYLHPMPLDTATTRTGRLTLAASGTYAVRVVAQHPGQGPRHRTYVIRTALIAPGPETLPDTFTFGDTLAGESLDAPGDIDRFRVHVGQPFGAVFGFQIDPAAMGSALARASLIDSATGEVVASLLAGKGESVTSPGAYGLAPGTYYLQVTDQGGDEASLVGHYTLTTTGAGLGPEIASDSLDVGDTVTTETIAPAEDIDRFTFLGTKRQNVVLAMAGTGTPGDSVFLRLTPAFSSTIVTLHAPSAGTLASAVSSGRLELYETKAYEIEVRGGQAGSYAFSVVPYPTVPESSSASLAVGDSIVSESIDTPGDIDRFTLNGTPGAWVKLRLTADGDPAKLFLGVWEPVGDIGVTSLSAGASFHYTENLQFPASGQLELTIKEAPATDWSFDCYTPNCGAQFQYTGHYRLHAFPMSEAPETAQAPLVLGDTVTEALEPIGDVDVFTYAGTAGDTVRVVVQYLGDLLTTSGILFNVYRPDTDALIAYGSGSAGEINSTGSFVLPVTGTYKVRVLGNQSWKDHGNYWLLLRGP